MSGTAYGIWIDLEPEEGEGARALIGRAIQYARDNKKIEGVRIIHSKVILIVYEDSNSDVLYVSWLEQVK